MKALKTKDIVLVALLTALYFALYMVVMMLISILGPLGHAISPGFAGLLGGTVLYFMNRKLGKMWEFTLMTAILMLLFTLMGGGYLPWVVSSLITAVIADLIASRSEKKVSLPLLACASGLMHVGQAWGAIIPSCFFLDAYRAEWIARGQTAADMDAQIYYTKGLMGLFSTAVTFIMAFAGIYLAYFLLRKHVKEA